MGKATRAGRAWTVNTITGAEGEEWGVDAGDGVIAYTSTRGGQTDIYLQPVAGGAEQELALAGEETNPNVSGNLVAFERQLAVDTPRDVYIYDLARDTLYQLTSTPGDEWLSDISVSSSGLVRVVYMVLEEGNFNVYARSFELPNTLAAQVHQPVNSDGSSTFNAKRGVVPLKFTLSEEGNPTCQLPLASLRLTRLGGVSPGPIDEQLYSGSPDSGTQFRIADCHYHYNLNPRGLGAGSYLAEILIDGSPVGEARFDLK